MAISTGTMNKRYISAISYFDQREIERSVVDVQNEADFLDIFQIAKRYVPTSMPDYHNFINSALYKTGDTTGATVVGSGTTSVTTQLTAGTSGFAKVGTLVLFPNNKVGRVQSVDPAGGTDELVIVSVDDTVLTHTAAGILSFFSNAQEEESSSPASNRYDWSKKSNKIQIFRERDTISDIQKASKVEAYFNGQPYVMYANHIKKLLKLRGDIAAAFIAGKMSVTSFSDTAGNLLGVNGNPVQTTRGLNEYVVADGILDTLTSAGTVAIADWADLVTQIAATRGPDQYMVWTGTAAYAAYSAFLKGLNSSGILSGMLMLDGKKIDLNVESLAYAGYTFDFSKLKILDHAQLFNFTGSAGFNKYAYFVPKGTIGTEGDGVLPRIRVRYMPQPMEGGMGDSIIRETHQGMLAPTPVGTQANFTADWITYQGLEILGAQHFVRQTVLA